MNVILTGATGVAGSAALGSIFADPGIDRVTALTRRSLGLSHPKLAEVVTEDFLDYSRVLPQLAGHDACLWCLGISQTRVTQTEYERITYDFTLAGARAMAAANPKLVFCFLSGRGADRAEKSRVLFARIKGKTENALLALDSPVTYSFRPGFIEPRVAARFEDRVGKLLVPVFRLVTRNLAIRAEELARAMIDVARHGAVARVLENRDLLDIAARATPPQPSNP